MLRRAVDGILFSNPIHLLGTRTKRTARPERTKIDVGGLRAERVERVRLRRVEADAEGVHLGGSWENGLLELDLTDFGEPSEVRWSGVTGTSRREGNRLTLEAGPGRGTVSVLR